MLDSKGGGGNSNQGQQRQQQQPSGYQDEHADFDDDIPF